MVFSHPAHALALGFGSGLAPRAPGTAGTLLAWLLFAVMQAALPPLWLAACVMVSVPIGWWACTLTASKLGLSDPGCIVWDEIAAFWLLLWLADTLIPLLAPPGSGWPPVVLYAAVFVVFRFFDAAKPWPVSWADRVFKGHGWRGGWGIMFDDLVAAACSLGVLLVVRYIVAFS